MGRGVPNSNEELLPRPGLFRHKPTVLVLDPFLALPLEKITERQLGMDWVYLGTLGGVKFGVLSGRM